MADLPTRLTAAVIGCGPIGRLHAESLAALPQVSLAAVCDIDSFRASECGDRLGATAWTDVEQMLEGELLDLVTVATPNGLHVEPTAAALKRGIHVFCEKPLATSSQDAQLLVELAEHHQCQLAVDYNRRYGFGYQQAKQWIDSGEIGRLRNVSIIVSDKIPPAHVAVEPAVMLSSLLVHHFDLVRHLAGDVERVQCVTSESSGVELISNLSVMLFLDTGACATIMGSYRDGQHRTRELAIFDGEQGEICVEDVTRQASLTGLDPDSMTLARPPQFATNEGFYDTVSAHLGDFVRRLSQRQAATVSGADGVAGLLIGESARRSLSERRIVDIRELSE